MRDKSRLVAKEPTDTGLNLQLDYIRILMFRYIPLSGGGITKALLTQVNPKNPRTDLYEQKANESHWRAACFGIYVALLFVRES